MCIEMANELNAETCETLHVEMSNARAWYIVKGRAFIY